MAVYPPRDCSTCGAEFVPHRRDQKRCKSTCRATRECVECGQPIRNGAYRYCSHSCFLAARREREREPGRLRVRDRYRIGSILSFCPGCGSIRLLPFREGKRRDPIQACSDRCRMQMQIDRTREYRRANPEKVQAWNLTRRSLHKGAEGKRVTDRDLSRLFARFDGRCFYCDDLATTIDHAIPLARGGQHVIGNLLPACVSCNSQKWTMTVMEFRVRKGQYVDTLCA